MPIEVQCPQGHKLKAPDKAAGKTVRCPKCQSPCKIPEPVVELEVEVLEEFEDQEAADEFAEDVPAPSPRAKKSSKASKPVSTSQASADNRWLWIGAGALAGSVITGLLMFILMSGGGEPDAVAQAPGDNAPQAAAAKAAPATAPEPVATEGTPQAEVVKSLVNAKQMLEKKQLRMFAHEFLPEIQREMERSNWELRPEQDFMLRTHLASAQTGEMVFNTDSTFTEINYVLRPIETIPNDAPDLVLPPDQPPAQALPGLGADLPKMLQSAVELLEAGKTQEFILSVFPEREVSRMQKLDTLNALVYRVTTVPGMIPNMIRDLRLAATAASADTVAGDSAKISIPSPLENEDPRTLVFEKVSGHWRFGDVNRVTREAAAKHSAMPNSAGEIAGERGTMTLQKIDGRWKLVGRLETKPIESLQKGQP